MPRYGRLPIARIVLLGKEQAVQPLGVLIEGRRQLDDRRPHRRVPHRRVDRDALKLRGLGQRRSVDDLDVDEAARSQQVAQGLRVYRVPVRDVAHVGTEERHPARGVERFHHDTGIRAEGAVCLAQQPLEIGGLEVLDDLTREQSADRLVGQRTQVPERIAPGRVEAMLPAPLDGLGIAVDAAGSDPPLAQHGQELAAAAPDVHHVGRPVEIRQVGAL